MREESHLDDMRAAIRGDFERLEERRGEQVLLRPLEQPVPEAHGIEASDLDRASPILQESVTGDDIHEEPKRSWIDRLLGL